MTLYDTIYTPDDDQDSDDRALNARLRASAARSAKRHALDWRDIADDNKGKPLEREARELARMFEREAEELQCPVMQLS